MKEESGITQAIRSECKTALPSEAKMMHTNSNAEYLTRHV